MEDFITEEPSQTIALCNETLEMVSWILYGSAGVVILTGNLFTFLVFVTTKRLRRSFMNIFLVSLAVADIMMAVLVVPGYAVFCNSISCRNAMSKHCWLMAGLKDIAFGGTVLNLAAISFDRFLAVLRPLRYQIYMTKRSVCCILVGIWGLSSIIALIRNAWLHTKSEKEAQKIDKIYNSILIFTFALLPILVILVVNVRIIQAIRRQDRRVDQEKNSVRGRITTVEREARIEITKAKKGTISCVLVVFVFLFSWLPLAFVNFSFVFGRADLVSDVLVKIAWLCLFAQSSANPFIYSFYRSDFRQAGIALICRRKSTRSGRVASKSQNELNS